MAKSNNADNQRLLADLSQQTLARINELAAEMDNVEKDADALATLGFDTSRLKDYVASARKIRDVLNERFGPPK